LNEKLHLIDTISYDDLYTEEYKDKKLYIIIREPLSNLIGAINVNLLLNLPVNKILEKILKNNDGHFNISRYKTLYFYHMYNENVTFVHLNDLNNFLEHIINIKPEELTTKQNHRTEILKSKEDIINEEPYLWSLMENHLISEIEYYRKLTKCPNYYIPRKRLI
jgi:hypothetical protein